LLALNITLTFNVALTTVLRTNVLHCDADDLLLLSASVTGLLQMLNICYSFAQFNDIIFNHKKSICFKVGPLWSKSAPVLLLANKYLQWVTSF